MGQFHRQQVSNAEIVALQDSWTAMPPSMFYADVPAGDGGRTYRPLD
ncbi:MAG: hypothetical protein OXH41_03735 [Chloroflexi bacterium]|nr:hypothetical protein [Chloroflexota bacterium]